MSDELDPYAPPADLGKDARAEKAAFKELVVAWEKLRLVYNALLLVPGLAVLGAYLAQDLMSLGAAIFSGVAVAVGANVAFLLGPLAELYLRGLFRNGEALGRGRWLIFGAGLVVSAGVFGISLLVALA